MTIDKLEPQTHPELVFGLVGPLGSNLVFISTALQDSLSQVGYRSYEIRLSHLMHGLPKEPWRSLRKGRPEEAISDHMTAGNALRQAMNRGDALAMLSLGAIRDFREQLVGKPNQPSPQTAYILRSLKHRAEVETLRRIYGPAFILIAAYAPHESRLNSVARSIAESLYSNQIAQYLPQAENLLQRDESEIDNKLGQDVQHTFSLADVIINVSDQEAARTSMSRFVELLFGNPFHTPSKDEQAMFFAFSAALRSASLARQVGAVITREDGSIIAVGTNEVPKAGGGQYWENDDPDGRDFRGAYDSSDRMRQNLLADILQRLEQASWLREEHSAKPIVQLVDEALYQEQPGKNLSLMKGAQFMSTIDFVRAVHAEMSAITNAARHGVGTQGCILYTTTFPCHDCAKHIVAAGIRRVVYVEPYPKSLVQELYGDSVAVDASDSWGKRVSFDPFVGVASKRYTELFRASIARKDERGMVAVWQRSNAKPNLPSYLPSAAVSLFSETSDFESFMNSMRDKDLAPTNEESDDA